MNNLLQTLRNLGPARLASLGVAALGLIGFFVYISLRLSTPSMALLYADLELNDSSQITAKLQGMNVPFQLRGDGNQILVPAEQVQQIRMALATEGLPSGGSIGYEIFDRTQSLGTSNFVQNVNHVRALEGELARTIRTMGQVKSARVHLVLPQRDLFSRTRQEASASIILRMKGTTRLDRPQVQAVQHLVASAVPSLSPARISIVDDRGTLLARGAGPDGNAATATADELRVAYESRVARSIEELLERSVGVGKVRAEVSAEFDYDRVTINTETFDPDTQVARSTQTTEEASRSREAAPNDAVSISGNLPEGQADAAGAGAGSQNSRTDTTTNFEISRTVKNQVREGGQIKRLSVAVLVDGVYENGTYAPRPPQQLEQFTRLVRSAVGFNGDRGDTVELVNMQFAEVAPRTGDEASDLILGFTRAELLRLGEVVILSIVGLLALLLVVRPLIVRLFEAAAGSGAAAGAPQLPAPGGAAGRLAGPAGAAGALAGPPGSVVPAGAVAAGHDESMIDIGSIEGRVKASSIKKIGEIVDKHPEEAVAIVRNWMYQES